MTDCNGNPIDLFTNQYYNILNGNSQQGYLQLVDGIRLEVGDKGSGTSNNWYFESTSTSNYYSIKSQDAAAPTKLGPWIYHYLNYHDASMNLISGDDEFLLELTDPDGASTQWCMKAKDQGFNILNKSPSTDKYMNYLYNSDCTKNCAIIANPREHDTWTFDMVQKNFPMKVAIISTKTNELPSSYTQSTVVNLPKQIFNNSLSTSGETSTASFDKEVESSKSYTYSTTFEQGISVSLNVEAGAIFAKAGIDVDADLKYDEENTWENSASQTKTIETSTEVSIPAGGCKVVTGSYALSNAENIPYTSTALVSLTGDVLGVDGQQEINNPAFLEYYINKNVKGMTVIDSNYSPTQASVTINGNMASMGFDIQEIETSTIDCDIYCNTNPDECLAHNPSATMETDTTPPQHEEL